MKKIVAFGLSAIMLAGSVSSSLSSCADYTTLKPMTIPNVKIKFTPAQFREFPDFDEETGVFYSKAGKFEWEIPEDQKSAIPQNAIIKIYPKKVNTCKSFSDKVSTVVLTTIAATFLGSAIERLFRSNRSITGDFEIYGLVGSIAFETIKHFIAKSKDRKYNQDMFNFSIKSNKIPFYASMFNSSKGVLKYILKQSWIDTIDDELMSHTPVAPKIFNMIKWLCTPLKRVFGKTISNSLNEKIIGNITCLNPNDISDADVKVVPIKKEDEEILSGKVKKKEQESAFRVYQHSLVAKNAMELFQQQKEVNSIDKGEKKTSKDANSEAKKKIFNEFKNTKGFDQGNPITLSLNDPSVNFRYVINGGDAATLYEALTTGRSDISDLRTEFTYEYLVPVPQKFNKKKYKSISSGIINLEGSPEKLNNVEFTKEELTAQEQTEANEQAQKQNQEQAAQRKSQDQQQADQRKDQEKQQAAQKEAIERDKTENVREIVIKKEDVRKAQEQDKWGKDGKKL